MLTPEYAARLFGGSMAALAGGQSVESLLAGGGVVAMVSHEPGGVLVEVEVRPGAFSAAAAAAGGPRPTPPEAGAVQTLRSFGSAQATFYATKGRYGRPDELVAEQILDDSSAPEWISNGYRFTADVKVNGSKADEFTVSAVPERYGDATRRSFLIAEDFVIRAGDHGGNPAGKEDPFLGEDRARDWDYDSPSLQGLVPIVDVLFALGSPTHRNNLILESLYALFEAQQEHVRRTGRVGTFDDLRSAGVLDGAFKDFPERNGYRFEFKAAAAADGRGDSFALTATPTAYTAGSLSFYVSPASGLRAADKAGAEATGSDPRHGAREATGAEDGSAPMDGPDDH
jgi:hypothetical protein